MELMPNVIGFCYQQDPIIFRNTAHIMEHGTKNRQIDQLSSLFVWLVGQLKGLKPLRCKQSAVESIASSIGMNLSTSFLMEVLRKCLIVSSYINKRLMGSALHVAQLMGDSSVMDKLKKLSLLAFIRPRCYPREVSSLEFE